VKPAALLLAGVLALTGCAKPEAPPPPDPVLTCADGFDALAARIAADRQMKLAPAPGEPYRYYNAPDGRVSYVVTEPSAPAHPAVVLQIARPGGPEMTGCAYGDRAEYETLLTYLRGLAAGRGR
jgi:hypothetical protein